jgi:hypothetical protein
MSVMIPEDVATLAGGPEPIGPPGAPPLAPPAPGVGPPGAAPPGDLPPELAGLLGGGAPPGGPEGLPPEGPPAEEGGGSEVDLLSAILDQTMEYMRVASDDIEKSKMMKAAAIVQDLLASNQKEAETAAGIGPAQRGMAKALGGFGGGP